jgi:hypothetical protein
MSMSPERFAKRFPPGTVMVVDMKAADRRLVHETWLVAEIVEHGRHHWPGDEPGTYNGPLTGIAIVKVIAQDPACWSYGNGYHAPGRVFSYLNSQLMTLGQAREKFGERLEFIAKPEQERRMVEIFHNVPASANARVLPEGYRRGHRLVKVFEFEADEDSGAFDLADLAFRVGNGEGQQSRAYYTRRLRSMCVGDVVRVGETWLACDSADWSPIEDHVPNDITSQYTGTYGTQPWRS